MCIKTKFIFSLCLVFGIISVASAACNFANGTSMEVYLRESSQNAYGFDLIEGTYNGHISVADEKTTYVWVQIDKNSDGIADTLTEVEMDKINFTRSSTVYFRIYDVPQSIENGYNGFQLRILGKYKTKPTNPQQIKVTHDDAEGSLCGSIGVHVFTERTIPKWYIYYLYNESNPVTPADLKPYANKILRDVAVDIENIYVYNNYNSGRWDENNNGDLDIYNRPSLSHCEADGIIAQLPTDGYVTIVVPGRVRTYSQLIADASIGANEISVPGPAYSFVQKKYSGIIQDKNNASNKSTVNVTSVSYDTVTFTPSLTKNFAAGSWIYQEFGGLGRVLDYYDLMVVGGGSGNVKFVLVHELLHSYLGLKDIQDVPYDDDNIMAYYSTTYPSNPTLRYRPLKLRYNESLEESQWDTANK